MQEVGKSHYLEYCIIVKYRLLGTLKVLNECGSRLTLSMKYLPHSTRSGLFVLLGLMIY